MAKICKKANSVQEVYETLESMANADGIKIPAWEESSIET